MNDDNNNNNIRVIYGHLGINQLEIGVIITQ